MAWEWEGGSIRQGVYMLQVKFDFIKFLKPRLIPYFLLSLRVRRQRKLRINLR